MTDNNDYQIFLVFAPIFSSLKLDSNKKATTRISIRVSPETIKPFDNNLESTLPILADVKASLNLTTLC